MLSLLPLAGASIRLRMKIATYHIMISSHARKLTDPFILNVRMTMEDPFTQDQPETDRNRFQLLNLFPLTGAAITGSHGTFHIKLSLQMVSSRQQTIIIIFTGRRKHSPVGSRLGMVVPCRLSHGRETVNPFAPPGPVKLLSRLQVAQHLRGAVSLVPPSKMPSTFPR